MSDFRYGMRIALVKLKKDPDICDKCRKRIQALINFLDDKDGEWADSTIFLESKVPA